MGNWDRVWEYPTEVREAFAYATLIHKGKTVNWETGQTITKRRRR